METYKKLVYDQIELEEDVDFSYVKGLITDLEKTLQKIKTKEIGFNDSVKIRKKN